MQGEERGGARMKEGRKARTVSVISVEGNLLGARERMAKGLNEE
jgi:hypothetical protein